MIRQPQKWRRLATIWILYGTDFSRIPDKYSIAHIHYFNHFFNGCTISYTSIPPDTSGTWVYTKECNQSVRLAWGKECTFLKDSKTHGLQFYYAQIDAFLDTLKEATIRNIEASKWNTSKISNKFNSKLFSPLLKFFYLENTHLALMMEAICPESISIISTK